MLPAKSGYLHKFWSRLAGHGTRAARRRIPLGIQQLEDRLMLTASDQLYVSTVYQDLLRRPAEASGVAFWVGFLQRGISRHDVALDMTFATDEYRSNQVQRAFKDLLRRPADTQGFDHYLALLKSGGTLEQMRAEMIGSAEYYRERAAGDDAKFLTAVYEDVFLRDVDAAGQTFFTSQMSTGVTRAGFAAQILGSPEYRKNIAEGYYEQYLFRTGDASGMTNWTGQLEQGRTDEEVMAGFAGSAEYSEQIEHRQAIAGRAPLALPGTAGQNIPVTFSLVSGAAGMPDELGVFVVDAQGGIGGIAPGAPGYAQAAMSAPAGQIVLAQGAAAGSSRTVNLPAGGFIGLYLVQQKTTARALLHNPANQLGDRPMVYFSLPQANPDLFDHVQLGANNQFAFEDLTGGGDRSFDDLVVQVTFGPTVTARLSNDTGSSATDSITSDPSVAGTVTGPSNVSSFRASFDANAVANGLDVLADLKPDGSFAFTPARLNAINGGSLADGVHTLHLQAAAGAGNTSQPLNLAFTLDSQGPVTTIQSPAQGSTSSTNITVTGNVADPLAGAALLQGKVDSGAFANTSFDASGNFSFAVNLALDGSADGDHTVTFQATDKAGNTSQSTLAFTLDTGTLGRLVEASLFHASREQDFVIPSDPTVLTFKFNNLSFATPAPNAIKDAFEAALVDSAGRPLVHTIGAGLDAFLNITRGETPVLAPGVAVNGDTVTVNLAGIAPGTAARLIFRLMNDDGTTTTSVRLSTATLVPNPGGQPTVATPFVGAQVQPREIDFGALSDVSASFDAQYGETAFDEDSNLLHVSVGLSNAGSYAVGKPLLVAIANISDPTVKVREADGVTPDGMPYYDFSELVQDPMLLPGGKSFQRPLQFYNPNRLQFTYDLVVLGQLNRDPEITSDPVVEALVGKPYRYQTQATDADGDVLSFALMVGPESLSVDAITGLLSWSPTTADRGSATVVVEVRDGKGGTARQQFTLTVAENVPNRPPSITSTAVVDGFVGTAYFYDADAVDADSDPLTYSLTQSPAGMGIDAGSGIISWTPPNSLAETAVPVVLTVTDGRGGTTTQSFEIAVHPKAGNHAPVIVSTPSVNVAPGAAYTGTVTSIDADNDALVYSLPVAPDGMKINPTTGEITWQSPVPSGGVSGPSPSNGIVLTAAATAEGYSLTEFASDFPTNSNQFNVQFGPVGPVGMVMIDGGGILVSDVLGNLRVFPNHNDGQSANLIPVNAAYGNNNAMGIARVGADFYMTRELLGDLVQINPDGTLKDVIVSNLGMPLALVANPANGHLLVSTESGNSILDIDPIKKTKSVLVSGVPRPDGMTINADGSVVYAAATNAGGGGHILGYRTSDGLRVYDSGDIGGLVGGLDGMALATGSLSGFIFANTNDGRIIKVSLATNGAGGHDMVVIAQGGTRGDFVTVDSTNGTLLVTQSNNIVRLHLPTGAVFSDFPVTVRVEDGKGGFDTRSFTMNVTPSEIRGTVHMNQPGALATVNVPSISGQADPWLAGMPDGSGASLVDTAPANSPVLAAGLPLIAGDILTFNRVTGEASYAPSGPLFTPDGAGMTEHGYAPFGAPGVENGIGNVLGPVSSLAGVFLGPDQPDKTPAPTDELRFDDNGNVPGGINYLKISPLLKQPFFIGDGRTNTGILQHIVVPEGATRLYLGLIDGFAFIDNRGAFAADITESIEGNIWTLYLDQNKNGIHDPEERSTQTDVRGDYSFPNLSPGDYSVREVNRTGWTQTAPASGSQDVTLTAGLAKTGVDFSNSADVPGSVHGSVFEDLDNDGNQGAADPGLQHFTVYLDQNHNGTREQDEISTQTNIDGTFDFPGLAPGSYTVAVQPQIGWKQTSSTTAQTFTLSSKEKHQGPKFGFVATNELPPNHAPVFSTTPITTIQGPYDAINDFTTAANPNGQWSYLNTIGSTTSLLNTPSQIVTGLPVWYNNLPYPNAVVVGRNTTTGNLSYLSIVSPPDLLVMDPEAGSATARWTAPGTGDWAITGRFEAIDVTPHSHIVEIVVNGTQVLMSPTTVDTYQKKLPFDVAAIHLNQGDTVDFIVASTGDPNYLSTGFTARIRQVGQVLTQQVGKLLRYDAMAADADQDKLTFDLPVHPAGMIVHPTLGTVTWIPTSDDVGKYDVILRVRDGKGGVTLQQFVLNIVPQNPPPVITSTPFAQGVVDIFYHYEIQAQGRPDAQFAYSLVSAALGDMTVDAATGALNWHPKAADIGDHTITVKATDPENGDSATQTFIVHVVATAANQSPVITSTPRTSAKLMTAYSYAVRATDADADLLTYELVTKPAGMAITDKGFITWQPTGNQFGAIPVKVRVTDGRGGEAVQEFSIDVRSQSANHAPTITSTPAPAATVDRLYRYAVLATDGDGDTISYSFQQAPAGMSIDSVSGQLRWSPTAQQLGSHDVIVAVTDLLGASTTQSFTLTVRGSNLAPRLTSTPVTTGAVGDRYAYEVMASDENGDPLTYSLPTAPPGMVISPDGLIEWGPAFADIGVQNVVIRVADGQGGSVDQPYAITVADTPPNHIPDIISTPRQTAVVGQQYIYQPTAVDADGDPLHFSLPSFVSDMQIDPATGRITWTPTAASIGTGLITVAANDPSGAACLQTFSLTVRDVNRVPAITSLPATRAAVGQTYRYDVRVTDADNDPITFSLVSGPTGMTIDSHGRITWPTTAGDVGAHHVRITADDGQGGTANQEFDVTVGADTTAPQVALIIAVNPVNVGDSETIQVTATDDVGVASLNLTVGGQPVALDSAGRASIDITQPGQLVVVATAADAVGNATSKNAIIVVIDPSVTNAPTVDLTSPADGAVITAPTDVIGTVQDAKLVSWKLEIIPLDGGLPTTIATGTTAVANGLLGKVDPTLLQNDSYVLRLTALNTGGLEASVESTVSVAGELKLGNFTLSFTDVSIPVAGIPILVTRTYDTLNATHDGELGFGWRLDFRSVDFRTSVLKSGEEPDLYTPFRDGARVYITLPGGQREGFTFRPKAIRFFDPYQRELDVGPEYQPGNGLNSAYFVPYFQPDKGVTDRLEVSRFQLTKQGHEYFSFGGGLPYNATDEQFGGSHVRLITKEGLTYNINATDGVLNSVTDRNGNALTFSGDGIQSSTGVKVVFARDARGRIISATDPAGGVVHYDYDGNGNLAAVTDATGNTVHFTYLANPPHRLDQVLDPLNRPLSKTEYDPQGRLIGVTGPNNGKTQYTYDLAAGTQTVVDNKGGRTLYQFDERGNTIRTVDALGGVTSLVYDDNNNVISQTDALGRVTQATFDAASNRLSETNELGGVTRYTYDANNNILTTTDPFGNTTSDTFNDHGNRLSSTDALGHVTRSTFDDAGNELTVTDANGKVTTSTYDQRGNLATVLDPLGRTTSFSRDANGRELAMAINVTLADGVHEAKSQTTYDASGRVLSSINPLGASQINEYDASGQLQASVDELGQRTQFVNDSQGNTQSITVPGGGLATFSYDLNNNETSHTDPAGQVVRREFDALNRVTAIIFADDTPNDPNDNPRQRTEYDALGRVTASIDERGNRQEFIYDDAHGRTIERNALGQDTIKIYDQAGRLISVTDPLGHTTRYELDALGRTVQTIYADGTSTSVTYDPVGPETISSSMDQLGRTTHFEYDALAHLTAVIDPMGQRTEYTYDEMGNRTSWKDANGHVTRFEFDLAGRRTAVVLPSGDRSQVVYDSAGRPVRTVDFNGAATTYDYDTFGRRSAVHFADGKSETYTYTMTGLVDTVTNEIGTSRYQYDSRGREVSRTDPDGSVIRYAYDAAGNRISTTASAGTVAYTFDALNRLATVTDADGKATSYEYDAVGRLSRTTLPNGLTENRSYDVVNHLTEISTVSAGGGVADLRYTLDAAGETTGLQELNGRNVRYSYDLLGRLVREQADDPVLAPRTIDYVYDAVGNRLTRDDSIEGLTSYLYDANDRVLTTTLAGQTTQYTYDKNGNNLSRVKNAVDQVFNHFDARNRLIAAEATDAAGTHHLQYGYNSAGIRVAAIADGVETRSLIDTSGTYPQVVLEYRPSGLVVASYVRGIDLISQKSAGATLYTGADELGTTRFLTDALGVVTDRYLYDSFGRLLQHSGNSGNEFLFTGELRDSLLGLDYLRARYYDPNLGRFVGRDPAAGVPESPMSLNRYLYANANPLEFKDPTGRSLLAPLTAITACLAILAVARNSYIYQYNPLKLDPSFLSNMKSKAKKGENIGANAVVAFLDESGKVSLEDVQQRWYEVSYYLGQSNFFYDGKGNKGKHSYKFVKESDSRRAFVRPARSSAFFHTSEFNIVELGNKQYTNKLLPGSMLSGVLFWESRLLRPTGKGSEQAPRDASEAQLQFFQEDWNHYPKNPFNVWNWIAMTEESPEKYMPLPDGGQTE